MVKKRIILSCIVVCMQLKCVHKPGKMMAAWEIKLQFKVLSVVLYQRLPLSMT